MKKKKITEEQMKLLREEIRNYIDRNVLGRYKSYLDLWKKYNPRTVDMYSDFVDMGIQGWNGFIFWRQADFPYIYSRCGFYKTMSKAEFMYIINELWIKTAVKMLRNDLCEETDELAY